MSTFVRVRGASRRAVLAGLAATLALTATNVGVAEAAGASTTSFARERALVEYNLTSGCQSTRISIAVADDRYRAAGEPAKVSSVVGGYAYIYDNCRGKDVYFAGVSGRIAEDAFRVQGNSRSARLVLKRDMSNLYGRPPIPLEVDLTWIATTPAQRTRERTPVVGPNRDYRTARTRHYEVRQARLQGRLVINGVDYASATPAVAQIDRERVHTFAKGDVPSDEDYYDEEE